MTSISPAHTNNLAAAPTVEPQATNPLTSKFTEAERKAVDDLRASTQGEIALATVTYCSIVQTRLPLLLGEAYPDKSDAASAPFEIWGLTLHPERVDDARLDVVLVKFLRARYVMLSKQTQLLISCVW
jgi:hypothetical protein